MRSWLPKGKKSKVCTPKKRERSSLFGCFNPKTQRVYYSCLKRGTSKGFIRFLKEKCTLFKGKHLVMILDNASIHRSKQVKHFVEQTENLDLLFLPPYSPEYQPIERFWLWVKTKISNLKGYGCLENLLVKVRKLIWYHNEKRCHHGLTLTCSMYQKILKLL